MSVTTDQISFLLVNRDDADTIIARNFCVYLEALHDPGHFAYSREMRPRFVDALLDYAGYLGAQRTNELLKSRFESPQEVATIEMLRTFPSDLEKKEEEPAIGGYVLKHTLKRPPSVADRTAIDALLSKLRLV